jgi:hypothetical protein
MAVDVPDVGGEVVTPVGPVSVTDWGPSSLAIEEVWFVAGDGGTLAGGVLIAVTSGFSAD